MGYRDYFYGLTGFYPYLFQERIAEFLLNGESVVFRAPTGAGKTWTTVAPYLYSLQSGSGRLADRLIYALPLRALATSLHRTVVKAVAENSNLLTSAKSRDYTRKDLYCSLQMGGENNDPFLEGDVIFCTIDQLLSTYLMMPLSLPNRLANIATGALIGSMVVLDEVHLLQSAVALGTVIEMLDRLRGLTQFVFMTATMSDDSVAWLARKLGARPVDLPPAELRKLPVQRTKKRMWRWHQQTLEVGAVEEMHQGGRTLVIVNQIQRAQGLFDAVANRYKGQKTKVECLHSMFFPEDRAGVENNLQAWFGREATGTDVILIATQVVEAGIDISADQILTDLAPMNSLIQRAGRTARYEQRNEGTFHVFDVESTNPYSDADQEITETRSCMQELAGSGASVDFELEQSWIERVHQAVEARDLAGFDNLYSRRGRVEEAILKGDRSFLAELVRDIDSVNVLLTGSPTSVQFSATKWPVMFGVSRSNVWKLKECIEANAGCVWKATEIIDESGPLRFDWSLVKSAGELGSCWLIAVGPEGARYSLAGLQLGAQGAPEPVRYTSKAPIPRYRYSFETWVDHVRRVMDQAETMSEANAIGEGKIERRFRLEGGAVRQLTRWSAALHDVGKLAMDWQDQAWAYETRKTGRRRTEPLAHTTKEGDEQGPKLPPHAVEGAFAVAGALAEEFPDAVWPVACAIARHHSGRAKECRGFELEAGSNKLLKRVGLDLLGLRSCNSSLDRKDFSDQIEIKWNEDRDAWLLYAYLARRLRLADQAGTAEGAAAGGSNS